MADLRTRDRGQIILIAAFALAVTFVALALIVNSAIFTENLASRGEAAGSDDALSMRAMVEDNVGHSIDMANRRNHSDTTELTETVEKNVRNVSTQTELQQSTSGALVNVTYEYERMGERIAQNSSSQLTFESSANEQNYAVAENVERVSVPAGNGTRAFRINASSIDAVDNSSAFEVKVNDSSLTDGGNEDSWRMRVWNPSGDVVKIRTLRNDGGSTISEDCEVDVDSPSFHIDVTRGTIDGQPCDGLRTKPSGENLHFASGAGDSYNIYFRNADQIRGNFSMVVHDGGGLDLPNINGLLSDNPYHTDAIYDVTVRYTYDTPDMGYETDIRVAPGEPDA